LAFHSGREADHSPPSSAEVKECVALYLHSPNTPSWRGAQLGGAQGQRWSICFLSSTCYSGWLPITRIIGIRPLFWIFPLIRVFPVAHAVIAILNCHSTVNVADHKNRTRDRCSCLLHLKF
jgi:hypothetical protein